MEESDMEEGEAMENEAVDPDVYLSYIDDRIQDVLGHFQKEFEGTVCADNLGSKFGAYGSFLPTYQRSPSGIPQPKSPQKLGGYDAATPPIDRQCEGACPSTSAPTNSAGSLKIRRIPSVHPCDDSGKKDAWQTECGGDSESTLQHDFSNRAMNSDETKTLKVRIKVGPENALARSNAAIYSGLGLDMSPSPSSEESPVREPSPKIQDALDESPSTVFQFYSGFQAARLVTYLLSPVGESPLYMTEKSIPYVKDHKQEVAPLNAKEPKEQSKSRKLSGETLRILNCKDMSSKICLNLKEANDVEAPSRKKLPAEVLIIQSLSKFTDNKDQKLAPRKVASVSKGLNEIVEKESMPLPDLVDEDPLNTPPVQRLRSRSDASYWKGELDSKANTVDKIPQDARLLDAGDEAKIKNGKFIKDNARRSADFIRKDSDGMKGRNDAGGPAERDKLKAPKKSGSLEHDAEKVLPGKSKSSVGKRKLNSSLDNGVAALEIVRESVGDATPSVRPKEKKKNSLSKKVQLEHSSNTCKAYEAPNGISASERKTSDAGLFTVGPGYRRRGGQENIASAMSQDCKLDHGDAILNVGKTEEKTSSKRHANLPTSEAFDKGAQPALQMGNSLNTYEVPQPPAPVVIEESWVGCDRCGKWRLLPYGIEPKQLPKKWVCSMISWLPGMNRCTVSEDETTKALHAQYSLPAPEGQVAQSSHNDIAHSGITFADPQHIPRSCDPVHQSVSSIAKKKLKQEDALNIANQSVLSQHVNLVRESSSAPTKTRNLSDANEYALGRIGPQQTSKFADIKSERRKNKSKEEKSLDKYPEGGDFVELEGKKFIAQGQNVQDSMRPSKKMKSRDSHVIADDRHLNHGMDGKTDRGISGPQAKMSTKNALKEEYLSSKASVLDHKDRSTHGKQVKAPRQAVTNGLLDHLSSLDVEKSDSVKKRKMKDTQKNFVRQADDRHDCQEEIGDTAIKKVKKARPSKCEGRELDMCKVDGRIESLSKFPVASRDLLMNGNGEKLGGDDILLHQNGRDLDAVDSLKRDICFSQHSAAATSSSSNVSGSHRSKANLVDGRSSPVESVSSSPFKSFSSDKDAKRSSKVNTNRTNAGFVGDSMRLSGGDANGSYGHYGQKSREKSDSVHAQSLERKRAPESRALDSKIMEGGCNLQGREVARMSSVKAKDLFTEIFGGPSPSDHEDLNPDIDAGRTSEDLNRASSDIQGNDHINHHEILKYSDPKEQIRHSKSGKNNLKHDRKRNYKTETDKGIELQNNDVAKGQKDCIAKIGIKPSIDMIKESNSCTGVQVKVGANGTSIPLQNRDNLRVEVEAIAFSNRNAHRTLSREEEKCSRQSPLHGSDKRDTYYGKSKPESYNHAKDHKGDPPCRDPHTKSVPHRSADVMVSVEPTSRDAVNALKQTEKVDSSSRNSIPNGVDATIPLRRDGGQSMADILKEARDLKHAANRLKDEGSEQIRTAMYFESALKFLHVASLSDNAKHGDKFSPMQMYTDTAKLCEFCAHEYEKYKDLSSAALAYKCMEVAYMKVVYSKSSTANKDRHELLSAPQIGESPSSSASDVENKHAMLDKESLAGKAANSPLIAGNHVIAARNRLNFTRILGFVEMVNLAMEASRRARNAFSAQKDAQHTEVIASVRRVLDFSFHDVEGLYSVLLDFLWKSWAADGFSQREMSYHVNSIVHSSLYPSYKVLVTRCWCADFLSLLLDENGMHKSASFSEDGCIFH